MTELRAMAIIAIPDAGEVFSEGCLAGQPLCVAAATAMTDRCGSPEACPTKIE
jgi:hypothetical protein